MRLDKFLCDALGTTRKESTQILKSGEVTVDGEVQKVGSFKVTEQSDVEWQGREIRISGPRYIMLYKPQGYVCSHEDGFNHTAFVLLDEVNMRDLHFAGRLDVDTTGLVLITDDGQWSHRITSPNTNVTNYTVSGLMTLSSLTIKRSSQQALSYVMNAS